jgi:hypothetical protein
MKANPARINRSDFYYVMNPIAPINHVEKAKFDILGLALTVGLLAAGLSLMRMVLYWAQ